MREDYFTATELAYLLHVDPGKLRSIIAKPFGLPAKLVGTRYVIPKAKFFMWYDQMKREGMLRVIFGTPDSNYNEVYAVRDKWLRERYAVMKGVMRYGKP